MPPASWLRPALTGAALLAVAALALSWGSSPLVARAALVAGVCLVLWLGEAVPPYVPTLLLWAMVPLLLGPLLLGPLGEPFRLGRVLAWSADPVLALFFGGFALGAAAERYGLDRQVAQLALRISRGRRLALLALLAGATAFLSMWMSNIAAAAMMIAALRPMLAGLPRDDGFRRALLLGIATGANFGGIATPIGTGPNAIAIAAISERRAITFLDWMALGLPLALGLVAAGVLLLVLRFRVRGALGIAEPERAALPPGALGVLALFAITVTAWVSEPLHGVPAAVVSLLATAALFGSRLLDGRDLGRIDWSTLLLIAGGIALGRLLEQSGVVTAAAAAVPWTAIPRLGRLLVLTFASAILAALMSNTATATMLIPLAGSLDPSPSTAVLIAIAASLGAPFVISTPPNAMVYGEGGVKPSDLLLPGLVLMLLGCLLVSATGPAVLGFLGIS